MHVSNLITHSTDVYHIHKRDIVFVINYFTGEPNFIRHGSRVRSCLRHQGDQATGWQNIFIARPLSR